MLNNWLYRRVDNSALIIFRVIFGLLITIEAWGAIATGWVSRVLLSGDFTFNFLGFGFLQPLPGNGMYYYYGIMGLFGVFIMLGFRYRMSIVIYGIMWSFVYLMQKSSYNNHYYLLMLLLGLMATFPAHRYFSVDAWRNPAIKKISMPRWVYVVIIAQLWIVYTYASIAKLYPDWLNASVPGLLMLPRKNYWLVGDILQQSWAHYTIAYMGILYDGLIIPALLWPKTRKIAFFLSIFFHLFNSFIFHIGIFPYLSLAFTLFFFPSKTIHDIFLRKKEYYAADEIIVPNYRKPALVLFGIYFLFQIGLPLRHWFIKDDVLWTEEGHRLSWRMMLRSKSGRIFFTIQDKENGIKKNINYRDYLSANQQRLVASKPDAIWQFCQRLQAEYAREGKDIAIYVNCKVRVNNHEWHTLIDPKVDMAAAKFNYFWHNDWILPSQLDTDTPSTDYKDATFD